MRNADVVVQDFENFNLILWLPDKHTRSHAQSAEMNPVLYNYMLTTIVYNL